jgi:ferredoxin
VRILLDHDKCQGHGRCYALAPELFESDDEGYSVLKRDGDVPGDLEDKARLAADNCPEFAIEVVE